MERFLCTQALARSTLRAWPPTTPVGTVATRARPLTNVLNWSLAPSDHDADSWTFAPKKRGSTAYRP